MGVNKNIFIRTKDFLVSGEEFNLMFCEEFDFLKTDPVPAADKLQDYYKSTEYISHTDSKRGIFDFVYAVVKLISIKKKAGYIESKVSKGSILDVGIGTGDFLVELQKRGWDVYGTEPNPDARKKAESKGLFPVSDLGKFQNHRFDVITLWHVLEHIPDLFNTVELLAGLLKPGGLLIIAVPNYKSYDAEFYGKYWAAYDVPRHIYHFSKTSIKKIFKSDFILEEIKPLVFDSYYVSLLSEKYKTGKKISLKSIFTGWRSNRKAKKSGEYSSLIYCLKRKG